MTYVSYFPEAKVKPGAPIRPRTHPSTKCYAKGPGVEPRGLVVKKAAVFTVFTQGAGKGKLSVSVWGPGKEEQEVSVTDNGDHTYTCQYSPQKQGKCCLPAKSCKKNGISVENKGCRWVNCQPGHWDM